MILIKEYLILHACVCFSIYYYNYILLIIYYSKIINNPIWLLADFTIKYTIDAMKKIHKKHIKLMLLAGACFLFLGAAGFVFYKNNLSRESRMYVAELAAGRSHWLKESDKPGPEASKVPILVYHGVGPFYPGASKHLKTFGVEPEMFERQMEYLKSQGYSTISFEQLNNRLLNNAKLPAKPVILTFDDGWENQYIYALPLLKKYNFAATFFVPVAIIGTPHYLNWQELREMQSAGMVIGSHTETHPFLDDVSDEKLKKELAKSKSMLESNLQKSIDVTAYPYGRYNDKVLQAAKDAGYKMARSTDAGFFLRQGDLLKLKGALIFNNFDGFLKSLGDI